MFGHVVRTDERTGYLFKMDQFGKIQIGASTFLVFLLKSLSVLLRHGASRAKARAVEGGDQCLPRPERHQKLRQAMYELAWRAIRAS